MIIMENDEFRKWAHNFADWIADYYLEIEKYPVKSQAKPGDIIKSLPVAPPLKGETMEQIFGDFKEKILPGISHWQSPNFFAYFPANGSFPSILAEMLTAALGAQCMVWETSPAAAELEEQVMEWLKKMLDLPALWSGVIQDTASTSTLTAILTAREKLLEFRSNKDGLHGVGNLRVYCSTETHSSVEKAVKIAGIGKNNLVKVPVDDLFRMDTASLRMAIVNDLAVGYKPLCVVATLGTTGCTSIDPLKEIASVCKEFGIWLHIDAAYAGTALLLPEMRWILEGIEDADSFIFNPHKWMFTNFDCSAYFVKDKETLIRTFEILPEYLKTGTRGLVNDYRDWGIQLGRRFRALKLWFVIRSFGVEGLQGKIREHITIASWLEKQILANPDYEILAPRHFSLVCFRFHPRYITEEEEVNHLNEQLLKVINNSGKLYISHTKLNGKYTLRMSVSQTSVSQVHVEKAWEFIRIQAQTISNPDRTT
jgi:aromatic-L-amino-acid/L-tryptophan decarboxylase